MFLYVDCPSGISGDMFLAALIDTGAPVLPIRKAIASLKIGNVDIGVTTARRGAISGKHLELRLPTDSKERDWHTIRRIIGGAKALPKRARERALEVFEGLAKAEARIHGVPADHVHFHEVGAADSIVDVVGACVALEALDVDEIVCSPLPLGTGFVKCRHGVIPLPAPATVELLKGLKSYGAGIEGETVTPTGAALMSALASECGPMPLIEATATGYGAGTKHFPDRPNVLRVVLGKKIGVSATGGAVMIEANVDDMIPQDFEPLMQTLFEAGALDVSLVPVHMKKNRPGVLVMLLSPIEKERELSNLLLRHSTTIGLRSHRVDRVMLNRDELSVVTEYGRVRYKSSSLPGGGSRITPEYDDIRKAASGHDVAMEDVRRAFTLAVNKRKGRSAAKR